MHVGYRCRNSKEEKLHSARHTHATLLLSTGVDIYTVLKLLGYKHVASAERYAHMTDKLEIEATETEHPELIKPQFIELLYSCGVTPVCCLNTRVKC